MYVNGSGSRAIERVLGVHHTTVITWIKQVGELLPDAYNSETTPQVGELDELEYPSSKEGTPQGGVISPLLANIALDGFENLGSDQWKRWRDKGRLIRGIRYADDAIFILKPGANIQKLRRDIDEWLGKRGIQINEAKTKVSKVTDGFNFLGWHFRVNSRGVIKSTPSHESYRHIKKEVKKTWENTGVLDKSGKKRDTETRLREIGSKVRGWRNYHRFCDMDKHNLWFMNHWLWKRLRRDLCQDKAEGNK